MLFGITPNFIIGKSSIVFLLSFLTVMKVENYYS